MHELHRIIIFYAIFYIGFTMKSADYNNERFSSKQINIPAENEIDSTTPFSLQPAAKKTCSKLVLEGKYEEDLFFPITKLIVTCSCNGKHNKKQAFPVLTLESIPNYVYVSNKTRNGYKGNISTWIVIGALLPYNVPSLHFNVLCTVPEVKGVQKIFKAEFNRKASSGERCEKDPGCVDPNQVCSELSNCIQFCNTYCLNKSDEASSFSSNNLTDSPFLTGGFTAIPLNSDDTVSVPDSQKYSFGYTFIAIPVFLLISCFCIVQRVYKRRRVEALRRTTQGPNSQPESTTSTTRRDASTSVSMGRVENDNPPSYQDATLSSQINGELPPPYTIAAAFEERMRKLEGNKDVGRRSSYVLIEGNNSG